MPNLPTSCQSCVKIQTFLKETSKFVQKLNDYLVRQPNDKESYFCFELYVYCKVINQCLEVGFLSMTLSSLRSCPLPIIPFVSLTGRGHDTFLCRITCKKARIWTFFWLDRKQYGWFVLFQLAKMLPSISCCWFQFAFLLA